MIDVGTPSSSSPENVSDVLRSNSYSLTRGGKVISSQPWSFHDTDGLLESMQYHSSGSSSSSTSDSEDPSSGDEVTNERVHKGKSREFKKCAQQEIEILTSSSDDSGDTDSEETESTVIVRPLPPLTDELLDDGRSSPVTCDELNDTLSSVSEELSFDHERSPFKEDNVSTAIQAKNFEAIPKEEDSQLSRSFEYYSELRDVTLKADVSERDEEVVSRLNMQQQQRHPDDLFVVESSDVSCEETMRISCSNNSREREGYQREFTPCAKSDIKEENGRMEDSVNYYSALEGRTFGRPPPSPSSAKAKLNKYNLRKQLPLNDAASDGTDHRAIVGEIREKVDCQKNHRIFNVSPQKTFLSSTFNKQLQNSKQVLNGKNGSSSANCKIRNGDEIGPISQSSDYESKELNGSRGSYSHEGSPGRHYPSSAKSRFSLSPSKLGNSDEVDYRSNRSPHDVFHGQMLHCHEDSELSDVSSGATSEDSAIIHHPRYRSSHQKGNTNDWSSPMLTGLVDGHVTRLATPPDPRVSSRLNSHCDDVGIVSYSSRHNRPRPPPVPRPRTLEGSELVPCHVYSPQRHPPNFHSTRENSLERNGKDSLSELPSSHRYQLRSVHRPHSNPRDAPAVCWCEEEEREYDSCDERHRHHRHSYHEGLHHAHLMNSPHSHGSHKRHHASGMRHRRSVSPCYECRRCSPVGALSTIPDSCSRIPRPLPYNGTKVGTEITLPKLPDSDYIPLWSCHSPLGIEERLLHLEGDKESLQLQVSVLSEQVEAQTEKIQDLEGVLEQKKSLILKTEEQLQKELMTRSSLETQRLELLSEISNLKLRQASFERENLDLRDKLRLSELTSPDRVKNLCIANSVGQSFCPPSTSTPLHSAHSSNDSPEVRQPGVLPLGSPPPTSVSILSMIPKSNSNPGSVVYTNNAERIGLGQRGVYSCSDWEKLPPRTPPPNARRKIEQFGTIPRQQRDLLGSSSTVQSHLGTISTTGRVPKGVMFGKGFNQFVTLKGTGKRSTSAPNLAETEKQSFVNSSESNCNTVIENKPETGKGPSSISPFISRRSPSIGSKPTGIKKIFTRLRRSSSGHLENDLGEQNDLKRGGLRATATARLGWTSQTGLFREPLIPFSSWTSRHIEEWFGSLGLSQYSVAARCFMESGKHISKATPHQLEKDVGVRHPLHRKKLQLAISCRTSNNPSSIDHACAKLDNAWALRWLDDVALPQYKDVFSEARIDGLVLNYLTYDDLAFLKISNLLHITSLKRGIQLLRVHNFDSSVLKRRSSEDEKQPWTPTEVSLWTNHRVMEWLKTVDLSEYAPNLRGSGVHGALLVYEPRFTSEFLASLLSISSTKTLLRRHLNTHFKELVGSEVVQSKRELQVSPGYIPLTTTAKIKMPRKSQFSLKRRKTKSDLEYDDLLCPLDEMPSKLTHYAPVKESVQELN